MTKRRAHLFFGTVLAIIGVVVILVELIFHWRNPSGYRIGLSAVAIGLSFFWFGWFMTRPKAATAGGSLWVSLVERLGAVVVKVRTGRRSGDVALVPVKATPIDPMDLDGDLDNPPHLGASPEVPYTHVPEKP